MLPDENSPVKGHYLGTEIDSRWWKRYRGDGFFARGNGEYWSDGNALCFRRYLTKTPLRVPYDAVIDIDTGWCHAGQVVFVRRVLKLIWKHDGMALSSGFILARDADGMQAAMAALQEAVRGA